MSRDDDFYELKIGDSVAISNNTIVRTIDVMENQSQQIDKFNHIDYDPATNVFTTYDSLKYNDDFSSKNLDTNDVITYKLNNQYEVSVTIGESITMDWDGDGIDTTEVVTESNLTRAMVHKINSNANLKDFVTAYNGDYSIDSNGNKITNNNQDNFLRIESNFPGKDNSFEGRVSITKVDDINSSILEDRESVYKNENESSDAQTEVTIGIYEREITLKNGVIKAQVDNLSTTSANNKFQTYLDKLDSFAATLSDVTDKYIKTGTNEYIYGEAGVDEKIGTINSIGLFSGSSVKTLNFNSNSVNDLNQEKLDYLATIQWKSNLSFDGKGQNITSTNDTSLLEFYRELRVGVSADKENANFLLETQDNIKKKIKSSYDNLVKVDKDDELLDLMKFQAAYTANAKIVTAIDEMIQTLLGLKR